MPAAREGRAGAGAAAVWSGGGGGDDDDDAREWSRDERSSRPSFHIDSEEAEFELVDEAELVEDEQITRTQLVDVLRKSQLACAGRQRIQQLRDRHGTVSY